MFAVQEFWLSRDASPANLTRLAYANVDGTFFEATGQISAPVTLTAGVPYFMRIQHLQYGGTNYLSTGVRIHTNSPVPDFNSEPQRVHRSLPEVQRLVVNNAYIREVQVGGASRTVEDGRGSATSLLILFRAHSVSSCTFTCCFGNSCCRLPT
jgi:hypothetical protein